MDQSTIILAVFTGLLFFARLPLAIWFFNREKGTNHSLSDYSRAEQTLLLFYWYTATKKENKLLSQILNTILLVVGGIFLAAIVVSEIQKSI